MYSKLEIDHNTVTTYELVVEMLDYMRDSYSDVCKTYHITHGDSLYVDFESDIEEYYKKLTVDEQNWLYLKYDREIDAMKLANGGKIRISNT